MVRAKLESEDAKGSRGEGSRRVRQEEMRQEKWRRMSGLREIMTGIWQREKKEMKERR